jgi:biopolymer transport protein ExbD/biopolymer transport protein TolR
MGMAVGGSKGGARSDINIVPLIDILLVLLIIFMVITPMLQKDVSVDMVPTNNPREMPDADKEDAVVVAVTRDGNVFLGSDQASVGELSTKVLELVATRVDKTVYIKSDARAKYERVVTVIDAVRSAGVDQLGLLTEEIE